ncbi:MAG: hypothetical protein GY720_00575 [bacterium]|nr:hypothetical protein [bacterium]
MSARTARVTVLMAVFALVAAVSVPRSAVAQQSPGFPPGTWEGELRFRHDIQNADSIVQFIGSGRLEVTAVGDETGSTHVEGDLIFAVGVRGLTSQAETARLYEATWRVGGDGDEPIAGGEVTARGVDAAKIDDARGSQGVPIEFVSEGTGTLSVVSGSCAGVSGTFTTDLIRPPGGAAGVAFTAPFVTFPVGPGLTSEDLETELEFMRAGYWDIIDSIESGKLSWDKQRYDTMADLLRFLIKWAADLNQAIVDAGFCGPATGQHEVGVAQQWLAGMVASILEMVSTNGEFFTAQELIEFYRLGAALGSFTIPDERIAGIVERYPVILGDHLDVALRTDQTGTVEAIHAAACMWGWADLKERSQS